MSENEIKTAETACVCLVASRNKNHVKKTKISGSPKFWQTVPHVAPILFQHGTCPNIFSLITNKTKWTEKVPKIAIFFSFSAQNVPKVNWPKSNF